MVLDVIQDVYINPSSYIQCFFEIFSVTTLNFLIDLVIAGCEMYKALAALLMLPIKSNSIKIRN